MPSHPREELDDRVHTLGAGIRWSPPAARDLETVFEKRTEGNTA